MRGLYFRTVHRTLDRVRDIFDCHVRRVCCVVPDEDVGGYRHWRCGRPRGHDGAHRFINYVWDPEMGGISYDPIDWYWRAIDPPRAPKRYGTSTLRQARQKRRQLDERAKRRAARAS